MKKIMSSVLAAGMILSSFPTTGVYALEKNDTIVKEKEPNNNQESAQLLTIQGSESVATKITNVVDGDFSNSSDEDWYKVVLSEPGVIEVDFFTDEEKHLMSTIPKDQYPDVDVFSTRYDGTFGFVGYPDDASQRARDSMDGNLYWWYSHKKDNEVFIRVKKNDASANSYNMGISYGVNASNNDDPHEPNTVFESEWGLYEDAEIKEGVWTATKWNNRYDVADQFSIQGGKKGRLTYSVRFSEKEFNWWNDNQKDYYKSYNVYAELNDGSYEPLDGEAVIGIPNQTFSRSVDFDNDNYTGKFVLSLDYGFLYDPNYEIKMDFEGELDPIVDTTAPEEISGLQVQELTHSNIEFNFNLPSDSDFEKVIVYRDGGKVSELNKGVFSESGLEAANSYTYKFVTVDSNGNSSKGISKTITTPKKPVEEDTTPPNEIDGLIVKELSHDGVTFNYRLPSDTDFEKILIYRDGSKISETKTNVFKDSSLAANKSYTYKFVTVDATGNTSNGVTQSITTKSISPKPENQELSFKRIAGEDRYATSKAFSQEIPANSLDTVLLSSGKDFPDALAGGVLNNTLNGIVLLVRDNTTVINEQLKEAKRVLKDDGKIIILGGKSAVSKNVEEAFEKEFPVERIGGLNRFETAINIAEKINNKPEEIVLTYGLNFADALSIVPYATVNEVPILLHSNGDSLQKDVLSYIKNKSSIKKVTIIGGTGVVHNSIEGELEDLGIQTVTRISGKDRYMTSLEIAKKLYPNSEKVALTNAYSFADALSGSRFAFDQRIPVILTSKDELKDEVSSYYKDKLKSVYLFGGKSVVSDSLKKGFE